MKIVRHCLSILSGLAHREREIKEAEQKKPKNKRQEMEALVDTVFENKREVNEVMEKMGHEKVK